MTLREVFESVLIELNKIQAPTLKLQEFNYLYKKAVTQYINKVYNIYDISQQTTDDLSSLITPITLTPKNNEILFPENYLHLLNCICIFEVISDKGCYKKGDTVTFPATKMTSDTEGQIMIDFYNKPSIKKPYYYIIGGREGNQLKCKILFGNSNNFTLKEVKINYIKNPEPKILTQEHIDLIDDTSQILEFPDYVNQEIINELVHLAMERSYDPRLATNVQITQSIARPTGQQ